MRYLETCCVCPVLICLHAVGNFVACAPDRAPDDRRAPVGALGQCPRCRLKRQAYQNQTEQIFQVSKVGFPIRRSMDQSLFAAPHSFSQRITSFFACACQGIHQMPLRHLIVLIANDHHLSSSETHATFYNACHHDDTSISSFDGHSCWNTPSVPERHRLRPASRDHVRWCAVRQHQLRLRQRRI